MTDFEQLESDMSDYKPANIKRLAEAMYKRECDYVGADHGGYCIAENIKTLQSFEEEIERLTTEVSNLKLANDEARKSLDGNLTYWHDVLRILENDILRRLREISIPSMQTAPLGCTTSAVCAAFRSLNECQATSNTPEKSHLE